MGHPSPFPAEKLVIGVLTSRMGTWDALCLELVRRFGPADFTSAPIPFDFSPYYDREMGPGIQRLFVSFAGLVDPSTLAAVKAETNALEASFREGEDRTVNLDPGLLNLSRFILASTKDSSHRIPLSGGMYAEITLVFEHGSFRPVEWTYPDYRSPGYIAILNGIRGLYKAQVRPQR